MTAEPWLRDGGAVAAELGVDPTAGLAFTTLVLAQLFNCFNARADGASAFRHLFTNRWLWSAVAVSLLQVTMVHVPLLQDAFGPASLDVRG